MTLTLHFHPFSSYCQKVLIALYEAGTSFEPLLLDFSDPGAVAAFGELWPLGRFPVLVDNVRAEMVPESSIIIEYLDEHYPGLRRMLPLDRELRLRVRMLDRILDGYVMTPMQKLVGDYIRPGHARDDYGVAEARTMLGKAYRWLEKELAGREWAAGDAFTMADCAAAPALYYADLLEPIDAFPTLAAYLARLRERPSFARVIEEAQPYRENFPPGWPEGRG